MKMLTGLLPASAGTASLFGKPVDGNLTEARRRVGYMSQSFSLYAELSVRQRGLRDDQEARGVAVEAMHDPRPALGAVGERCPTGDQRVDQSVVPVTRRGVDHQAGRLVDHGEVIVLEDDGERKGVRREGTRRLGLGNVDVDLFPGDEGSRRPGGQARDLNPAVSHETGGLGP